jgi:hypothetical protein
MASPFGSAQGRLGDAVPACADQTELQTIFIKEEVMSSVIDPEAATPSIPQAFEESDRNPPVIEFGGADAGGGQTPAPGASESRVTEPGPAPSADAGLQNYDTGDNVDSVEDEAEREG